MCITDYWDPITRVLDGAGGWEVATGSTAGYLFGFIVAAFLVGLMAERGQDRNLVTSLPAFIAAALGLMNQNKSSTCL